MQIIFRAGANHNCIESQNMCFHYFEMYAKALNFFINDASLKIINMYWAFSVMVGYFMVWLVHIIYHESFIHNCYSHPKKSKLLITNPNHFVLSRQHIIVTNANCNSFINSPLTFPEHSQWQRMSVVLL